MTHFSLHGLVQKQVSKVLRRGQRMERFDQIRQRHFWSSYLFVADPTTNMISAGSYDIFKVIPGGSGQGYPTNVNLTLRETNWLNSGRVPDNQNFAIMELGATVKMIPNELSAAANPNGIFANLTAAQQAYILPGINRNIQVTDLQTILSSVVLEMSFLTNNVPLGFIGDFSQSSAINSPGLAIDTGGEINTLNSGSSNGVPAAAFRRKLEIPILLQHGENMGMRLSIPRPFQLMNPVNSDAQVDPGNGGTGIFEVRIDWWAIESFVEQS